MAIQFARCQIVKRSEGGNSCRSASYNGRSKVKDERTGNVYYFEDRVDNAHHEVMLPKGVDEKFRDSSYLWNAVEKAEKRCDAQVAKELILALPDDANIDTEFRIEFAQRFVKENFVDKGLAAQIDIHAPHGDKENNWHAHILVTTRRFSACGTQLHRLKARDLNGTFYKGKVMEGDLWGEISRDLQNKMFEEKGLPNRVDPLGIVPQEHLGPVRMRNIENDALQRAEIIKEANEEASKDPDVVLDHLMKNRSTFNEKTLDWFISKHVLEEDRAGVKERILAHKSLVPLYDRETGEKTGLCTTRYVRSEEEKLVRFAEAIDKSHSKASIVQQLADQTNVSEQQLLKDLTKGYALTKGQRAAFDAVVGAKRGLSIIRGRAGVGKSTVLNPIREAYEQAGYQVVGLAPTHKAAHNLQGQGFDTTMTAHKFVFAAYNNKIRLPSKSLVVVDEAGMIGTEPFVELMHVVKQTGSKVLLVGDERQLASIQRGGLFEELAQRHGSVLIDEIKRQQAGWQKEVAQDLAEGRFDNAVRVLDQEGKMRWNQDKSHAKAQLIDDWAQDVRESIGKGEGVGHRFILATRNGDVDALNMAARDLMKEWGLVEAQDYEIKNDRGRYLFAVGERIQFAKNDKDLGIVNGWTGCIKSLNEKQIRIKLDSGKEVSFDPGVYQGLRYGYAGTVYKSQGATLDKTYILHDRVGGSKNNYVALTRHVQDIGLYINKEETKSLDHYIHQISREEGRGASLQYATLEDLQRNSKDLTLKDKVVDTLKGGKTKLADRFHSNKEFYDIGAEPEKQSQTEQFQTEQFQIVRHEVMKVESSKDLDQKEKETILQQAEYQEFPEEKRERNEIVNPVKLRGSNRKKDVDSGVSSFNAYDTRSVRPYQIDYKEVRDHLSVNIEGYARSLLGNETKSLSNAREMVWDQKGSKISLNRRTGQWQDFKSGEKGDLIGLTSYVKGGEKHDAYSYAAAYLGLKEDNRVALDQNLLKEKIEAKQAETERLEQEKLAKGQAQVDKFVTLSQPIKGSLAERYLRDHRGIKTAELGNDLRFLPVSKKDQVYKPGLIALARNKDGKVTACQVTYLDPKTADKATDIKVNKRTFGKISGSFVELQKGFDQDKVYIAEGVETALSLKEAGIKGHIVAGLGVHNLDKAEHLGKDIVIVGDNDGPNSPTQKRLDQMIQSYREKSVKVELVQPSQEGQDFNDVLRESGTRAVGDSFKAPIQNNQQQERNHGNEIDHPHTNPGSSASEKSELEEQGISVQKIPRKGDQTTAQNQSQGNAGNQPLGESNKDNSDSMFDMDAWKAEMERLYPEETQAIKESHNRLTGNYSFEERIEKTQHLMNNLKVNNLSANNKQFLNERLEQHIDYFKNNLDQLNELSQIKQDLYGEVIQKIQIEVFKDNLKELSILDIAEKIESYGQKLDICRDREKADIQKEFYQFIKAGQEACPDKLKTIYQASDGARSIVETNLKDYKDIQTDNNKEVQSNLDRGFER